MTKGLQRRTDHGPDKPETTKTKHQYCQCIQPVHDDDEETYSRGTQLGGEEPGGPTTAQNQPPEPNAAKPSHTRQLSSYKKRESHYQRPKQPTTGAYLSRGQRQARNAQGGQAAEKPKQTHTAKNCSGTERCYHKSSCSKRAARPALKASRHRPEPALPPRQPAGKEHRSSTTAASTPTKTPHTHLTADPPGN